MTEEPNTPPTFREALIFWLTLGCISFGGPSAQISLMHEEVVTKRKWLSEHRFLLGLNYCMLLPGPEAQQLATYIGWRLHGVWGGIVAGVLFLLPASVLFWILSYLYVSGDGVSWVQAIFEGLRPAVVAIVTVTLVRLSMRALHSWALWGWACLTLALVIGGAPYFGIVGLSLLIGFLGSLLAPQLFVKESSGPEAEAELSNDSIPPRKFGRLVVRSVAVVAVCITLWVIPVGIAVLVFGEDSVHVTQSLFFSWTALISFGGAYAVLPHVAHHAIHTHGWVSTTQMIDGLALAETTPGPLIMVLQFVGFLGGWNFPPMGASPLWSATTSAALTTWVTFLPSFLWIFLGAPFVDQLSASRVLRGALSAVTAAVVGVMTYLASWFAVHTLLTPQSQWIIPTFSLNVPATLLTLIFLLLMTRWAVSALRIVSLAIFLSLANYLLDALF